MYVVTFYGPEAVHHGLCALTGAGGAEWPEGAAPEGDVNAAAWPRQPLEPEVVALVCDALQSRCVACLPACLPDMQSIMTCADGGASGSRSMQLQQCTPEYFALAQHDHLSPNDDLLWMCPPPPPPLAHRYSLLRSFEPWVTALTRLEGAGPDTPGGATSPAHVASLIAHLACT